LVNTLGCWFTRFRIVAAVLTILLSPSWTLASPPSPPDHEQEAVGHYRLATAAYGLGDYAEAAEQYERAFALMPDHVLLFNAAMSRKRAGQAERASTLFANYLRLFAGQSKAAEARRNLDALQKELAPSPSTESEAADHNATSVQLDVRPGPSTDAGSAPQTTASGVESSPSKEAPSLVAPAPQPQGVSLAHSTQTAESKSGATSWFSGKQWYFIGAGVLVTGLVLGLVLATRQESPPLWGRIE
jgi:tetratricopeptide (TPR) repeat protein